MRWQCVKDVDETRDSEDHWVEISSELLLDMNILLVIKMIQAFETIQEDSDDDAEKYKTWDVTDTLGDVDVWDNNYDWDEDDAWNIVDAWCCVDDLM